MKPIVYFLTIAIALPSIVPPAQAQTMPASVAACYSIPACRVTTVIIGGITYWVVTQNGQQQHFPMDSGEYLEDPEGTSEEWEDDVFADNRTVAAQCRLLAQQYGAVYVRHYRLNRAKFRCVFRTYRS